MMKRILFLASLLIGLALAFAPLDAPRVIAQTFSGQPSPGYVQIGQGAAQAKWLPLSNQLDVFLVIGDSQAVGQGTSAQSPLVPSGQVLAYCANGTIVNANDPVCSAVTSAQNANTGSVWPAFGIAYNRKIGFVATGVSGSTQSTSADFHLGAGNWQDTTAGSNYQNSLTALNAALPAYVAAGYAPVFRGIVYVLGNNDGAQIDNAVITSPTYITAYTLMAANYRSATIGGVTYPHLPIYVAQIGTTTLLSDYGYAQIRSAQQAITTSDPNSLLANVDLASFNIRGLVNSGPHLTQAGYNLLGTQLGAAVIPFVQANIPYQLFTANGEAAPIPPTGTVVQIVGKDNTASVVPNEAFGGIPEFKTQYSAGAATSPSGPTNGAVISIFSAQSFGATTYGATNQGALLFSATQNHTDTAKGTQGCIYTTANGANAPTCRLLVGQGGAIQLSAYTAGAVQSDGGGNLTASTLTVANGGTGNTTGAAQWVTSPFNVNFASAGDNAIPVPLPSGLTRICAVQLEISGASGSLVAATFGLFTATGGGGTAIIANGTAITVSTAADNTANNAQLASSANLATGSYLPVANTVYFRVVATTAQTGNVQMHYRPCP